MRLISHHLYLQFLCLVASLCHLLTQRLIDQRQAIRGIDLLSNAITKVQLHSSQLTSIHADICLLSLLAKCLKPALYFLDIDITDISKEVITDYSDRLLD